MERRSAPSYTVRTGRTSATAVLRLVRGLLRKRRHQHSGKALVCRTCCCSACRTTIHVVLVLLDLGPMQCRCRHLRDVLHVLVSYRRYHTVCSATMDRKRKAVLH